MIFTLEKKERKTEMKTSRKIATGILIYCAIVQFGLMWCIWFTPDMQKTTCNIGNSIPMDGYVIQVIPWLMGEK
jgi:hypothetical protein